MRSERVFVAILTLCLTASGLLHAEGPTARLEESSHVSFTLQYRITGKEGTDKVVLTALVPKTLEKRQKIVKTRY